MDADTEGIIALTSYFYNKTEWNGPFERLVWAKIKATGKDWLDLTLRELDDLVGKASRDYLKEWNKLNSF